MGPPLTGAGESSTSNEKRNAQTLTTRSSFITKKKTTVDMADKPTAYRLQRKNAVTQTKIRAIPNNMSHLLTRNCQKNEVLPASSMAIDMRTPLSKSRTVSNTYVSNVTSV